MVGAGPAGASAAKVIAEQGYKVLVLERKKQVGIPVAMCRICSQVDL
ncbi:MAG: NAD(P)-binding protein [Zhaonellaceae bacterium]